MPNVRRAVWGATVSLALTVALTATAAANDITDCHSGDQAKLADAAYWDTGIAACSRLIAAANYSDKAAAFGARAGWLNKQKKFDRALADINRALSLAPKLTWLYDAKADIFSGKGDFKGAIATYDQAIRMDPTYAAAYTSRGMTYEAMGDIEKARASYRAALKTPKSHPANGTGLQTWAHRVAEAQLKKLSDKP